MIKNYIIFVWNNIFFKLFSVFSNSVNKRKRSIELLHVSLNFMNIYSCFLMKLIEALINTFHHDFLINFIYFQSFISKSCSAILMCMYLYLHSIAENSFSKNFTSKCWITVHFWFIQNRWSRIVYCNSHVHLVKKYDTFITIMLFFIRYSLQISLSTERPTVLKCVISSGCKT